MTLQELLGTFSQRPRRFALLDEGLMRAMPQPHSQWLEIGCNEGDGAAHLAQTWDLCAIGVDINAEAIERGRKKHTDPRIELMCADAACLPLLSGSIDGIFSEAAYALLPNKEQAAGEYARVLKPGGKLLISDFALKQSIAESERREYAHIPCFAGVAPVGEYVDQLAKSGFRVLDTRDRYAEFISIALWLAKSSGISIGKITEALSCGCNTGTLPPGEGLMKKKKLTYVQLVLERM